MVEQPIKKVQMRCQICYVNQCLFHYWNQDNSENIIPQNALFIVYFSVLCQWHSLIFGHRCETFHVSWPHIPLHLFNISYNFTMWTSSSCSVHQVRGSLLSGIGIRFQNLILLHFDQITGLKSLSIYLFLLARLNLGLQMDRLPVQASQETLCLEREKERERERERERESEREVGKRMKAF